ncbi:MAG: serine/threonine protein phosphatase PrpC [Hyphomicrobiaceae bacterium]|jgi:serine/threonine protein phosphatase PrpC
MLEGFEQSAVLVRCGALFNDKGAVGSGPITMHVGNGGVGASWGATDVGRVRSQNQDCFAVGLEGRLIVVADGMGGHSAGEVASTWAVETLVDLVVDREAETGPLHGDVLGEAFELAQRRLCRASMLESGFRGMGTTLVAGLVISDLLHLAHVGDVRAYLYRDGVLTQLTRDHSTVQMLVDSGELQPHEALEHPQRNEVTQALGQGQNSAPSTTEVVLQKGDRVLLCCDGLWSALRDDAIVDALRDHATPQGCTKELITGAKIGGGLDNITAVVYEHP